VARHRHLSDTALSCLPSPNDYQPPLATSMGCLGNAC